MRVIRPSSMATLTAVSSSPPMSIRTPGDPLSQMAVVSMSARRAARPRKRGDLLGTLDRTTSRGDQAAAVGDDDDIGGEDVEETLQVALADGGEEALDDLLLLRRADRHPRTPGLDVLASAVGDLADGGGRLPDRLCDLVVGDVEHLAEHEHGALGRGERLEHGQHGDRDVLGELDIGGDVGARQQWLRQPLADVLLAPSRHGPQPVQRLPGDDADQVGPRLAHLGVVDVRPSQPRLLDDVLGVGRGAEHLVGDREQQAAVEGEVVLRSPGPPPNPIVRLAGARVPTRCALMPTSRIWPMAAPAARTPWRSLAPRSPTPRCSSWSGWRRRLRR